MQGYYDIIDNLDHRMHILLAMDELLKRRDFKRVSIEEISVEAGISRPTFYRYFNSKQAVPKWYFDFMSIEGVCEVGRTLSWREGYVVTFSGLVPFWNLFQKAFQCPGYNALTAHFYRSRNQSLIDTVTDYKKMQLDDSLLFQIECCAKIESLAIGKNIMSNGNLSIQNIAQLLESVVPHQLHDLLDKPVNHLPKDPFEVGTILQLMFKKRV
jgi:hypothetical protein